MGDITKVLEGVMAINKPKGISSAQALRDLQTHFDPSHLFAPSLAAQLKDKRVDIRNSRKKAKRHLHVKIGHGGTLDPMATGVLITGIWNGTKHLQGFLECTKSYEAVVLFGAATDTYDTKGAVVKKAPYTHITEQAVRDALGRFRGKIMQRPPIYSALRIDGKRLYEYAREGKELPREIQERPVEVEELELVEWMDGGSHGYAWPAKEAEPDKKEVAEALLDAVPQGEGGEAVRNGSPSPTRKRKHAADADDDVAQSTAKAAKTDQDPPEPLMSGALQPEKKVQEATKEEDGETNSPKPTGGEEASEDKPTPPAARLRMTVTSGFYVRSLCHDLGEAVGSLGIMSELVRTRQGEFELGKNVLEWEDLAKGEDVWGPKVQEMLDSWNATTHTDFKSNSNTKAKNTSPSEEARLRRRNSSSPDER